MAHRPFYVSLGWTLRDYVKRVWDNSGEDNVLFLAGGIAFNIILAALPFILLLATVVTWIVPRIYDQLDRAGGPVHRPLAPGALRGGFAVP
jgi:membrane protein